MTKAIFRLVATLMILAAFGCKSPENQLGQIIGPDLAHRVTIRRFGNESGKDYLMVWRIEYPRSTLDELLSGMYEVHDEESFLRQELQSIIRAPVPPCTIKKRSVGTDQLVVFIVSEVECYLLAYKCP